MTCIPGVPRGHSQKPASRGGLHATLYLPPALSMPETQNPELMTGECQGLGCSLEASSLLGASHTYGGVVIVKIVRKLM